MGNVKLQLYLLISFLECILLSNLDTLDIVHILAWSFYHDSLDIGLVSVYSSYRILQDHCFPYLLALV